MRNLIKEPLTIAELKKIAAKVGDAKALVAPKRRAEAEGLAGEALYRWLAEDGARVRRPIVISGANVTLGFAGDAREVLEKLL